MSSYSTALRDKLFQLLPAYVREIDGPDRLNASDPPGPLQALLRVIEEQADAIDGDITQLFNDAFIETCEPWAIPYIGDLVGTTPLFDESRIRGGETARELFGNLNGPSFRPQIGLGNRADVAKTIYFRRRKGTLPMLEELARDVTGWPAHAVEFFQRLQWNQRVKNHLRMHALQTPDLRSVARLDRLDGAFDETCRTVDVRPIGEDEGWYGIRKIGFFVWRLLAHRFEAVDARRQGGAGDFRWRFSPLGQDAPLFSARRREDDETGLTQRQHVPQAISRPEFHDDMRGALLQPVIPDFSEYYGLFDPFPGMVLADERAMMIFIAGAPVPLSRVRCRNLDAWGQPSGNQVAIDVVTGRIALGPLAATAAAAGGVSVSYHHGFSGNLGGGSYRRRAWLIKPAGGVQILDVNDGGAPGSFATIAAALAQWAGPLGKPDCIIRVGDSRTYTDALSIEPADGHYIAIEAAEGSRPHLLLPQPLTITGNHDTSSVTLGGLLVEGRVEIAGSLGHLRLIHTTLVPGVSIASPDPALPPAPPPTVQPSIAASETRADGSPANTELRIEAAFSITGRLRIPDHAELIALLDCAVDGLGGAAIAGPAPNSFGPACRIERSTMRGQVRARQIDLASDSIFDGLISVQRQQTGCIRFSYVPPESVTPRRYRCQPDLAVRRALDVAGPLTPAQAAALRAETALRVRPEYTSEAYGQPAWLQLARAAPDEIATGSEDGADMGLWCHLKQPQRAANLKLRLEEYLPFGLEPALIRVT
jgi:hypothetical protein